MTASTPRYALTYPESSDLVRDGAAAIQDLAEDTEAALFAHAGTNYSRVPTTINEATNWDVTEVVVAYRAGVGYVRGKATRLGSALSPLANGNVGNATLFSAAPGFPGTGEWVPVPAEPTSISSAGTGRMANFVAKNNAGALEVDLTAVATNADITVGEVLSFAGVFILTGDPQAL